MPFLIFNYSKPIGRTKNKSNQTRTIVRGNVVIRVEESFIDRFNVPIFTEEFPLMAEVKSSLRNYQGKGIVELPRYYRKLKPRTDGYLVEIKKRTTTDILSPQFLPKRYYLRFPDFFSTWLIDNALFQTLGNATDFDKLIFSVGNGENREIVGEETGYGTVKISTSLIQGEKPYYSGWGETVLICMKTTKEPSHGILAG
jgi:hypothetical protein